MSIFRPVKQNARMMASTVPYLQFLSLSFANRFVFEDQGYGDQGFPLDADAVKNREGRSTARTKRRNDDVRVQDG